MNWVKIIGYFLWLVLILMMLYEFVIDTKYTQYGRDRIEIKKVELEEWLERREQYGRVVHQMDSLFWKWTSKELEQLSISESIPIKDLKNTWIGFTATKMNVMKNDN